jgi:DNA-binding response OmpR family regulator
MTSKGCILLVDYDSELRRVIRKTLETNNYEVDDKPSGESALEQCQTTEYDLILLELDLPGMSGPPRARSYAGSRMRRLLY